MTLSRARLCKSVLTTVLLLVVSVAYSQNMLTEVIEDYLRVASNRMTYEEVPVKWTMGGKIQAEMNEGINNLFEENPSIALDNFTNVIRADGSVWQAYYYRAICAKQLNRFDAARRDLEQVKSKGNALYECNLELGKIALLQRDIVGSQAYFRKAMKTSPERAEAYYEMGTKEMAYGLPKAAIKNLNESLKRDPNLHYAHLNLFLIENHSKNEASARAHLDAVLKTDSLNRYALLFRSLMNVDTNNKLAHEDLNRLLRANPGNIMGLYLRGVVRSELGIYDRAFPDFHKIVESLGLSESQFKGKQTQSDKMIDIQNTGSYVVSRVYGLADADASIIKRAYCLLVLGRYDDCIAAVDESSLAKTEPLCFFLKAVANEHKGQHGEAYRLYDLALRLDNDILDAHKKRGIYEQELKLWDKSVDDFTQVIRLNPENYVVYKIRGVSHYWMANYKKSIADYTEFIKRDTTDLEVVMYRGFSYMKDGQFLNASVDLLASRNGNYLTFPKVNAHIDSLLQLGDTTKTMSYLNQLTTLAPNFTEGYATKMKLHVSRNNWATISATIDKALANKRSDAPGSTYSYLLTVKAMLLSRAHKYDDAITKLNEAVKVDKNNSLALFERGKLMLSSGKPTKAIPDLRKASSLGHREAEVMVAGMN